MVQAEIARLIEEQADPLVAAWMRAVREDENIQSDVDLTEGGLIDHVPQIIEELCAVLRAGRAPRIEDTHEARVHAYTRFRQNYRARDLVRETSLLRVTLCDYLSTQLLARCEAHNLKSYLEALRIINLYIDEELRYAVSIYTEAR